MLTPRQNLLETIKGGNPDRFVKQYEAFMPLTGAPTQAPKPSIGGEIVNGWGVTTRWPEGQIGAFPVHDDEHIVLKDITEWKNIVRWPNLDYPDEAWVEIQKRAAAIDRNEEFVTAFVAPGIFEQVHYLMSMEEALIAFYEEPEAMHELIDFIADYEIRLADVLIDKIHPDAMFHHDDWGSQISTFLSPKMFAEFFVEPYKRVYKHWKENGVELIIHHSDSFAATLIPSMIEIGIDIWQGVMTTNNTPEMVKKYGGQITFMGDINSGVVDFPGWTKEIIDEHVERACKTNGKLYFIPGTSQGGANSSFPGVYEATDEAIDRMSKEMF